jgi:hypothetical protein
MRFNRLSALCLAAGLSVCAVPALAQNYDPDRVPSDVDAKQRQACTPDVMRLCNDYVPNIPDIVACLKRERLRLSPDCAEVFAAGEPAPPAPAPAKKTAKTPPKKDAKPKTVSTTATSTK